MKVAIVLNGNARSITSSAVKRIHEEHNRWVASNLGENKLFVSNSLEDAKHIAKLIVKDNYDVVMSGGGDGTFTQCVTDILELTDTPPAFGMLKMGTGNALADVLGVSTNIQDELSCAHMESARTTMSLVKINNIVAPFAGFGLDAMVLNDYDQVKNELDRDPVFGAIKSKRGALDYGFAITLRSIWKLIINAPTTVVKIYNIDNLATEIDSDGVLMCSYSADDLVYSGSSLMVGASTVPYYGMGFRMFPQANPSIPGFQLRVVNIKPYELLTNLPSFLTSELSHKHITDFRFNSKARIEIKTPVPAHIGGNYIGKIREMTIESVQISAVLGSYSVKSLSKNKDNFRQ